MMYTTYNNADEKKERVIVLTNSLMKLDNSNLWDRSYEALKKSIIQREFPPDQKLSIHELSEQLGVSRTPIRDALQRLEAEGLVRTVPKVGTFVVGFTEEDVHAVMDTRTMLELWVVEKISLQKRPDILSCAQTMDDILAEATAVLEADDFARYLETDYNLQFHLAFMHMGQNPKNIELYKNVMNYRKLALRPEVISQEMIAVAQQQHMLIVEALRGGSTEDIRHAIIEHLNDSSARLLENVRNHHGVL